MNGIMKPILFSTPMVRAILEGRKTMTRRVVNPQPPEGMMCHGVCTSSNNNKRIGMIAFGRDEVSIDFWTRRPYQADDILWVRETWMEMHGAYFYRADADESILALMEPHAAKWRPSIFMPREAARLFLRVKDVRVERIQDITEADALKEGCVDTRGFIWSPDNEYNNPRSARDAFQTLWDGLNAKRGYGWDTNPLVWVYTFERCERPQEG